MDLYHLCEEATPTDRTALETVVDYIKDEIKELNVRLPLSTGISFLAATHAEVHAHKECKA